MAFNPLPLSPIKPSKDGSGLGETHEVPLAHNDMDIDGDGGSAAAPPATKTAARPAYVAVELKFRSGLASVAKEDALLDKNGPFQYCVTRHGGGAHEPHFSVAIKDKKERLQVLVHAAALGLRFVLYCTAVQRPGSSSAKLSRCVLVDCGAAEGLLLDVAAYIRETAIPWAYDPTMPIPETAQTDRRTWPVSPRVVRQALALRRAFEDIAQARGGVPPEPARKVSPSIVAAWNATKGGVDTMSEVLKTIQAGVHYRGRLKVLVRLLEILTINVLRVQDIASVSTEESTFVAARKASRPRESSLKDRVYELASTLLMELTPKAVPCQDVAIHFCRGSAVVHAALGDPRSTGVGGTAPKRLQGSVQGAR